MHRNPNADEIKCILEESHNVAVVGLSDSPFRTSHTIASAIQRAGYRIFPINPNLTGPVLGEQPYATLQEVPESIDIVDVFRRSEKGNDCLSCIKNPPYSISYCFSVTGPGNAPSPRASRIRCHNPCFSHNS